MVNNDPNFGVFLGRISAVMTVDENNENIILYGGSASDKEWSYINNFGLLKLVLLFILLQSNFFNQKNFINM